MNADTWRDEAACAGQPPSLFVEDEWTGRLSRRPNRTAAQEATIRAFCDRCPVVGRCLREAVATGSIGIFGGTTTVERRRRNLRVAS